MNKNSKNNKRKNLDLIDRLAEKSLFGKRVISYYHHVNDVNKYNEPMDLLKILSLPDDYLSGKANEIYTSFESKKFNIKSIEDNYNDFKWKITAFVNIQDIFDAPIFDAGNILNVFHLWYFYYESKYILIESIVSGLNGLYIASDLLLRLFLEFSLLQNYYYRICNDKRNYNELEKFLLNGVKPKWQTLLNEALPKNNFCKPIKSMLYQHHKALSQHVAHPYNPENSPKQFAEFIPEQSVEGIFFWIKIQVVLQSVLWCYYVNFPMLFHPVNIIKKFGFNYPMGLFVDEVIAHTVKKSLSETDYAEFKHYSDNQEQVESLISWYNSQKKLSNQEIMETWDEKENGTISSISEGYGIQVVKHRALMEAMAFKSTKFEDNNNNDSIDIHNITNYSIWKALYKKLK